ncbi:substrate-binding domain-containing protein [Vulgatibacter incomptus]|uniref:Uncharacterized protein n=1 Tax=Vulgatibacter incomptus TaxID=1391653 RepID=A0A0K1PF00_9BACT|nr:substrate-binding domain-containing protein [Vulgatibacter incomptus]AKU92095.1 hypothetical protein AKJ08_2482 [Vulgatibacter incomptus]
MESRKPYLRASVPLLVAGLALLVGARAQAVECASLPNPVYLAGSSAVKPVLKKVSQTLSSRNPSITLVYQSLGSCAGVDAIVSGTKVTATAKYWDAAGAEVACDLPAEGANIDIGISDVYAQTCNYVLDTKQRDFLGPVQVMTFVAPVASSESSISAAAAYVALGFGGKNHVVAPWDNPEFFFIRPDSSGTKNMIAEAIGLPASKWQGNVQSGSGDVNTAVSNSVQPNKTIGILAADFADANRDKLKILAFQADGAQRCGYYPDSTPNHFDKINVRDGRYAIWGSVHFLANTGSDGHAVPASGNPAGDAVHTAIRFFSHEGLSVAESKAMIKAEADAYTVPLCAMRVKREKEVGAMSRFVPDEPCGCYFESLKGATTSECSACESDADCSGSTPTCRYGFCESR